MYLNFSSRGQKAWNMFKSFGRNTFASQNDDDDRRRVSKGRDMIDMNQGRNSKSILRRIFKTSVISGLEILGFLGLKRSFCRRNP